MAKPENITSIRDIKVYNRLFLWEFLKALKIQEENVYVYCNGRDVDLKKTFYENEVNAAATLPALYIDGIAVSKNGAWPCGLTGKYNPDLEELKNYSLAAKNQNTFDSYMRVFLNSDNLKAAQ